MKTTPADRLQPLALDDAARSKTRKVVIASSLGNGLEMYDFTVYSFFAVIIGKLFFPADSELASLLMSLATLPSAF